MFFQSVIADQKKVYGLKPGDIVRTPANDTLYRYFGIINQKKGLPGLDGDNLVPITCDALVFITGMPMLAELPSAGYSYLLTIPKAKKPEGYNYLDCKVEELDKLGNISPRLWNMLGGFEREHLSNARLLLPKRKIKSTFSMNLYELLNDYTLKQNKTKKH